MKYYLLVFLLVSSFFLALSFTSKNVSAAGVFTVNDLSDRDDRSPGDGVCFTWVDTCTLRAAITEANAHTGADTINFNISGTGPFIFKPTSSYPTFSDTTGGTIVNGYTQPGASANTLSSGSNAVIKIQIEGVGDDKFGAFYIKSANNIIKGLAIYKFKDQIYLATTAANNNLIVGDFIGTNANATYADTVAVNGAYGVELGRGANYNKIGTTSIADRNVVSGNGFSGIITFDAGTDHNVILNNIIGLSPDGKRKVGNLRLGIDINTGSSFNQIGDGTAAGRNIVSGNDAGITLSHSSPNGPHNNVINGNFIGTDLTGNAAFSYTTNNVNGINLKDGSHDNSILNNVVGNNTGGIYIESYYSVNNVIQNNRVGIGTGGFSMPNRSFGVWADVTRNNKIGPGNRIVNNLVGIKLTDDGSSPNYGNTITQNLIYSNQKLGIDLKNDEVTLNDAGDADSGPNTLLNFPVLSTSSTTTAVGTACAGCRVEVFLSDRDSSGYGEGKQLVGSGTANSSGNFSITISGVSSGNYLTSTATDSSGNTSEFSLNKIVQ